MIDINEIWDDLSPEARDIVAYYANDPMSITEIEDDPSDLLNPEFVHTKWAELFTNIGNTNEGQTMKTNCDSLTKKSNLCRKNATFTIVVDNFRYRVCGVHKNPDVFRKGRKGIHVEPQLITATDPVSPQPMNRATVLAGMKGVVKASEMLAAIDARSNPVTKAWLDKENTNMEDTREPNDGPISLGYDEDDEPVITSVDGVGNLPPGVHDGMHEEYDALNKEVMAEVIRFIITFSGSSSIHGNWQLMRFLKDHYIVPMLLKAKEAHPGLVGRIGAAPGFDYLCGRALMETDTPFDVYLPSPTYLDYYWSPRGKANRRALPSITSADRERIDEVIAAAHATITVCEHHEFGQANMKRNQLMINGADRVWIYNPETPGTKHAYGYAKAIGTKRWVITADEVTKAMTKEGTTTNK